LSCSGEPGLLKNISASNVKSKKPPFSDTEACGSYDFFRELDPSAVNALIQIQE
jgi:hypothetical protein